jgi:Core-2/I-Branching enzyme
MHAVLITAYKDYPSLLRLVRRLDRDFFKPYIHLDRKSRIGDVEIDELRRLGAEVRKTFVIRWGSYTHLQAILHLLTDALRRDDFDYVHVISGQDYPLWSASEFKRRCNDRIFIDYAALNVQPDFVRNRYELGDPFHFLLTGPPGSGRIHKFLSRRSRRLHERIGTRRTQFGPYASIYKALVWSSFPAWAARPLLDDPKAHAFLEAIRTTRVAEEVFFPTYFLNSDLAPFVVKDDLRYTDWRHRNGSKPAYLDESDTERVLSSGALFARKVSSETSARLLDAIDATRFGSQANALDPSSLRRGVGSAA